MMHATEIIAKKRDGASLTEEEIRWFVGAFVSGEIPDYQMAALSMAICINGMEEKEVDALSLTMLESGTTLKWPADDRPLIDKHSTGGVGDKVSLVLAPLLACCDLRVPMISGRGLGITGGTLDKLEAIPGFRTDLSLEELQQQVQEIGCAITGTSQQIAPADQRWYTLRDVTATVPSLALITSSIMCKKLAEGLDALVLDVKCGSGTSMQTEDEAHGLAQSMVTLGTNMGVTTRALISNMEPWAAKRCWPLAYKPIRRQPRGNSRCCWMGDRDVKNLPRWSPHKADHSMRSAKWHKRFPSSQNKRVT